jgi:hypothetical protein
VLVRPTATMARLATAALASRMAALSTAVAYPPPWAMPDRGVVVGAACADHPGGGQLVNFQPHGFYRRTGAGRTRRHLSQLRLHCSDLFESDGWNSNRDRAGPA